MFDLNWVNHMLECLYKITTSSSVNILTKEQAVSKIKYLEETEPKEFTEEQALYIHDVCEYFGMKIYYKAKVADLGLGGLYAYNTKTKIKNKN